MQRLRLPAFFSLIAALGSVALLSPPSATADPYVLMHEFKHYFGGAWHDEIRTHSSPAMDRS